MTHLRSGLISTSMNVTEVTTSAGGAVGPGGIVNGNGDPGGPVPTGLTLPEGVAMPLVSLGGTANVAVGLIMSTVTDGAPPAKAMTTGRLVIVVSA